MQTVIVGVWDMSNEDFYHNCKDNAKKHAMFYHYTNLDSLLKILSSQSFRLTQLALLNDLEEEDRIDKIMKNKVFAACFNHSSDESIPLWKIYSKDKYGLRLGFPSISFFENHDSYFLINDDKKMLFLDKDWETKDACIVDIEYVDDPYRYFNYMDPLDTGAKISYPIDIGLIKRKAWDFEFETRARVTIKSTINARTFLFKPKYQEKFCPFFDHIYCKLKEEEINQMTITFNPFMSEEIKGLIKTAVKAYIPEFRSDNFTNSMLENKIRV